ncbi:MAG: hypothetical protein ABMB14_30130 [Myxococcota bacterium]
MRWWTMVVLASLGCAPAPLAETPIFGGTEDVRDAVRAELQAFDDAAGAGRVHLSAISLEAVDVFGRYDPATRRITLPEEIERIGPSVRHELCHALEAEEQLVAEPSTLFDALADGLFDPDSSDPRPSSGFHTAASRREEVMATFCELGPLRTWTMAVPCAPDPTEGTELAAWLSQEVWAAYDPAPGLALGAEVHPGALPGGAFPWQPVLTPTAEPGVVGLSYGFDAARTTIAVDLYTGAPTGGAVTPLDSHRALPPGLDGFVADVAGWETGPAAALGFDDLHHLGLSSPRLWVWSPDGWRGGACRRPDQTVFTADDRVWTAWSDGIGVGWAPVD